MSLGLAMSELRQCEQGDGANKDAAGKLLDSAELN